VRKLALAIVGVVLALSVAPSASAAPFAYVANGGGNVSQYELDAGGLRSG
jgi:hypothetical protein